MNVGGNLFQRFGVFAAPPVTSAADLGRFTITGEERDRGVFEFRASAMSRQPRPISTTAASLSLAGAVKTMARSQLGRSMTEEEVDLIVRFLHTLTGEYEGRPVTAAQAQEPPR